MNASFQRLIKAAGIKTDEIWVWEGMEEPIPLEEVAAMNSAGERGVDEPYGDTWRHPVKQERDREYHLRRILYFVQHPEEIKDIDVDNVCSYIDQYTYIYPKCKIEDGWHRLAAAIILNLSTIEINYSGREDVLDYLLGKVDEIPTTAISI